MASGKTNKYILLNAVTATTTTSGYPVDNAGRLSLQFIAANITSGSAVFTVDVSNDASNWVAYNRMTTNVTNTNAQTDTRVASIVMNTNAGSMVFIPAGDTFNFFRVTTTLNNNVGGTYSAIAYVD